MVQNDLQITLQFLSLLYAVSNRLSPDTIRRALEGPITLDDIPLSAPWPAVEAVIRLHPTFLSGPGRQAWWDSRDADRVNRVRLTKALVDAADNGTLEAVDLLSPDLRRRPELVRRIVEAVEDIADVLTEADFSPAQKQQMLADVLLTV